MGHLLSARANFARLEGKSHFGGQFIQRPSPPLKGHSKALVADRRNPAIGKGLFPLVPRPAMSIGPNRLTGDWQRN